MGSRLGSLTIAMLASLTATAAAAQTTDQARIETERQEKGRQVVAQACTTCHTTLVRMLQVHKQTAEQWKDTVYFMISRGAQVMPNEIDAVAAFLTATAGNGRPGTRAAGAQTRAGDGAAILQRTCQQCHELATASNKRDSEDWPAVIARMMAYGARLTAADQEALLGYLSGSGK